MDKILTIVVPTYNMEKFLDKCLSSLIINDKKLLKCLEVLVVIDGATDGSCEIAHSYEKKYPETFRIIEKENGNYGSCVNRGLKEASGKYIKILDADDWFDTKVFEGYLSNLLTTDVDLVLNDTAYVDIEGQRIGIKGFASAFNKDFLHQFGELLSEEKLNNLVSMHGIAYKTINLRKIDYKQTEGISYTDTEWMFFPMTTVETFCSIDATLYNYLVGREGQTMDSNIRKKKVGEQMDVLRSLVKSKESFELQGEHEKYLHIILERMCWLLYEACFWGIVPVQELKMFEQYVECNAPRTYREMYDYMEPFKRDFYYVRLMRHPWRAVIKALLFGQFGVAKKMFQMAHCGALLKPRVLARIINRLTPLGHDV